MSRYQSCSGVIHLSRRVAPSSAACRWTSLGHPDKSGIFLSLSRLRFRNGRRFLFILISKIRGVRGCFFDQTNPILKSKKWPYLIDNKLVTVYWSGMKDKKTNPIEANFFKTKKLKTNPFSKPARSR